MLRPSTSGLFGCLCVVLVIVGIVVALVAAGRRKPD